MRRVGERVSTSWLVPASALAGVAMIGLSFAINDGPPKGVTVADLRAFGAAHHTSIVWGAWLQTVGTTLLSAFAIVLTQPSRDAVLRALVLLLGGVFFLLGLLTLTEPELPPAVTSLASLQAVWWVAAAVFFARFRGRTPTHIEGISSDESLSAAR